MTQQTKNGTMPSWMKNLVAMYTSGQAHAFTLHFNVRDYAVGNIPLTDYLFKAFAKKRVLVRYNLAEGITFALDAMRDDFDKYVGLDKQTDQTDNALNAILGTARSDKPSEQKAALPKAPAKALALLETLLNNAVEVTTDDDGNAVTTGQACIVIEYAESVCPNAEIAMMSQDDRTVLVTLERLGADPRIAETGNIIILATENLSDLHPTLRRASCKYEAIEVPLPDYTARLTYIEEQVKARQLRFESGLTAGQFAAETAMLNHIHIEDVCLRAVDSDGVITRALIKERKGEIIRAEFGEVIEPMETNFTFDDIGGLEQVKKFFKESVIDPIRNGVKEMVPQGVLMTGPAGTGKTIMAQAVAKESGLNCVTLNPAKLFGQYVGNTERNLDRALKAVVAMKPTIVFIDEIDQTVSRNQGGDSGVSNRFFKRLLEFMSDTTHRGEVIFLAASNRPDYMDAALKRPGRFDIKVPFLVPDEAQRESIFRVMARRYQLGEVKISQVLLDRTKGWTGAEIEAAAVKAFRLMRIENIDASIALHEACARLRPSTADIELMTMLAIQECGDADMLPAEYRKQLDDREELDKKISARKEAGTSRSARTL